MQIKGWMIDAARLPEPLPYYRKVIDFCAGWGFNVILFRLADDQGSALCFASHPELAAHLHAFSASELRGLVKYATKRGIQMIPEIESFGHTGYITRSPMHTALCDNDPTSTSSFTGVIPNHPDTLALVSDLYREVAEIFTSPYLHAGCDEVNWGGSAFSQDAIDRQGRARVWTDYLNKLNEFAKGLGKELMIWADHVLGVEPERQAILAALSHDIILVDWNYWDSDPSRSDGASLHPGPIERGMRLALEQGFRVIGAPAWGWCRWGVRAGESQMRNIDAFADIYLSTDEPRALGVIVTNWVPSRFLPGSNWDATAYVGTALNKGSASARSTALPCFVLEHYGAEWDETWADIYLTLYRITPLRKDCAPMWMAPFQPLVWASEGDLAALLAGQTPPFTLDSPFTRLRSQIAQCELRVRQNQADFQAFALTVEYLEHIHWRSKAFIEASANTGHRVEILGNIAHRDAQILTAMTTKWDAERFIDDPAKFILLVDLGLEDQPLLVMQRAAEFSARLAEEPGIFDGWKY